MSCIEIEGPQNEILEGLAHVTNPETGKVSSMKCFAIPVVMFSVVTYRQNFIA